MSEPNRVLLLNRDLMAGVPIANTCKALGYTVVGVHNTHDFVDALVSTDNRIALGVIDMNGEIDWPVISNTLNSSERTPPVIAFGPHVDIEGRKSAKESGVARAYSNRGFHRDIAQCLEKFVNAGDR